MDTPLVSIVIPSYNAEEFLPRTLESATRQTYANIEIVIVDDGSKDETRQIAEAAAAADSRIRVLSIPNGGVANARNVGTVEANGEFVAFLDADDLWHPTKIALQVKALSTPLNNGELPVASYAFMRFIDRDDNVSHHGRPLELNGQSLARHLYFKPVGNGSSLLVRRDIVLELGGYDPSWAAQGLGGCEDIDFEFKVVARYPIACVPLYLVGYREYQGNMSSNRVRMARSVVRTVQTHLEQNRHLPRWASRYARTSTLEYACAILFWGRNWGWAIATTGVLFATLPHRGVRFVAHSAMDRMRWLFSRGTASTDMKRPFYTFDPADGTSAANLLPDDRRMLIYLAAVDAKLRVPAAAKAQSKARLEILAFPSSRTQARSAVPARH